MPAERVDRGQPDPGKAPGPLLCENMPAAQVFSGQRSAQKLFRAHRPQGAPLPHKTRQPEGDSSKRPFKMACSFCNDLPRIPCRKRIRKVLPTTTKKRNLILTILFCLVTSGIGKRARLTLRKFDLKLRQEPVDSRR
jgi:hypothetical protein